MRGLVAGFSLVLLPLLPVLDSISIALSCIFYLKPQPMSSERIIFELLDPDVRPRFQAPASQGSRPAVTALLKRVSKSPRVPMPQLLGTNRVVGASSLLLRHSRANRCKKYYFTGMILFLPLEIMTLACQGLTSFSLQEEFQCVRCNEIYLLRREFGTFHHLHTKTNE